MFQLRAHAGRSARQTPRAPARAELVVALLGGSGAVLDFNASHLKERSGCGCAITCEDQNAQGNRERHLGEKWKITSSERKRSISVADDSAREPRRPGAER